MSTPYAGEATYPVTITIPDMGDSPAVISAALEAMADRTAAHEARVNLGLSEWQYGSSSSLGSVLDTTTSTSWATVQASSSDVELTVAVKEGDRLDIDWKGRLNLAALAAGYADVRLVVDDGSTVTEIAGAIDRVYSDSTDNTLERLCLSGVYTVPAGVTSLDIRAEWRNSSASLTTYLQTSIALRVHHWRPTS